MDDPSIPQSDKRPWPVWKMFFVAIGLLLLVAVLLLFVSTDEPPPVVSDLAVVPLNLPDDQNAYALVMKAAALVKTDFFKDGSPQLEDLTMGKNWDAALARKTLDGTEGIWPLWEQAARTPQGQAPSAMPNLRPIQDLAKLAQIRIWDLAHNANPDAAVASLFTTLQIGRRLEQSRGDIICYSTGGGFRGGAMNSLRGIATEFKPSAAILRQALQQLEADRPDKDGFAAALRGEFRTFSHELENPEEALSVNGTPPLSLRIITHVPYMFHPNLTRRLGAEATRDAIDGIDLKPGYPGDLRDMGNLNKFISGHRGNMLGLELLLIQTDFDHSMLDHRLKTQSTVSANEAFLALALYHREHGALPATLDALVPDYLPAVPRDYFDGQPIRYSRDFRAVWSVGSDHFTVTGTDLDSETTNDEVYLPLDFAAPAANPKPAPATPPQP